MREWGEEGTLEGGGGAADRTISECGPNPKMG